MNCKFIRFFLSLVFLITFAVFAEAQDNTFNSLKAIHRVNVHGDELMAISVSPDEQRIAIGTEKGELIIWNIEQRKIEKRFVQSHPIHAVQFLIDGQNVITAGGNHTGVENCSLGKWNIATGKFQEWRECGKETLFYLSAENENGLVVAANALGYVTVWNAELGKQVAAWHTKKIILGMALLDNTIYISQPSKEINSKDESEELSTAIYSLSINSPQKPEQIFAPEKEKRILAEIKISPDKKMLAVNGVEDDDYKLFVFDAAKGSVVSTVKGYGKSAWTADNRLLVTNGYYPQEIITINPDGKTESEKITDGGRFHQSGTPAEMTGVAISKSNKKVWETFQIGGVLAEDDLEKKTSDILINSRSLPFAMDVIETINNANYLVTGGDDRFVRVWNLSDLTLLKEFQVENGVPQGVAFINGGKKIVYSVSGTKAPTKIFSADIQTGQTKQILSVNQPFVAVKSAGEGFVYNFGKKMIMASADTGATEKEFEFADEIDKVDTSANAQWLAVADKKGNLWQINLTDGSRKQWTGETHEKTAQVKELTAITITNDGQNIYTTEFFANLRRWNMETHKTDFLTSYKGQSACLKLSADEKFVLIGGNHHDIGVYDAQTGAGIFYTRDESSDFYVTNAWMKGSRLIYTTDGGVLIDGLLEK